MMSYFRDIDIRTRIIASSVVMILIFLFVALRDIYVLEKISNYQNQILQTVENTNLVLSVKYEIKADHETLREIQLATELSKIHENWIAHLRHTENIISNLNTLVDTVANNDFERNEKRKISTTVNEIIDDYLNKIKPGFKTISDAKDQYVRIDYTVPEITLDEMEDLGFEDGFSGGEVVFEEENIVDMNQQQTLELEIRQEGIKLDSVFDVISFKIKNIELISGRLTQHSGESTQNLIDTSVKTMLGILFTVISILILITILLTQMIITPIEMLKERINKLALGILAKSEYAEGNNEISDIINATNCLAEGLQKTSDFAQSIGEGNFDINFKPLSSHDILGNALLNMRQSLKNAKEHEVIRKQEEQLSKWAADGRSQFGEIIRSSDNLKNVSNLLISNMVKYINANQGGVFVYNDDVVGQENIELVAAYAYNRKKHLKKIIPKDDGLLWTSVHEKTSIYITEVPKDYAEIKSGLGSAYPTCILIVPLVVNERVEGLFELASFHPMEDYKIQFVEKIAESAATNFASIKMNKKTNELLKKTRDEAEIMQAQEEELRFKIDTLQRLEIQSQRTERQLQTQISKLLYLLDNHGIDIPEEFRTAEYNREEKEEI